MIRVELNTVVARPVEDVFDRLADLSGYSGWMPKLGIFLGCGQTSEGPVGEGTTYYDKGLMGTFRGEIVEFRAPTRIAFRESLRWLGVEVMEARPAYELVRTQAGTEVRHRAEGRLFGIFGLMEPVVARVARGERKRTVEALKRRASLGDPIPPVAKRKGPLGLFPAVGFDVYGVRSRVASTGLRTVEAQASADDTTAPAGALA